MPSLTRHVRLFAGSGLLHAPAVILTGVRAHAYFVVDYLAGEDERMSAGAR